MAVLLDWGYSVSIESGHLIINPKNNMSCVKHLTNSHKLKLMVEILQKIGRDALTFHSHSASKYGPTLAGGVTLQFTHVLTGSEAYAIFNANLTRSRNTKSGRAGDPLPTKQFHVAKHPSSIGVVHLQAQTHHTVREPGKFTTVFVFLKLSKKCTHMRRGLDVVS